jgi:O-antigen ligase
LNIQQLTPMAQSGHPINLRTLFVVFLAFSVSLPIALLSLAKTFVFLAALFYLCGSLCAPPPALPTIRLRVTVIVLTCMLVWAVSLLWTGANQQDALIAFVKHGKLLTIPILVFLIRNRDEARWGVWSFLSGQTLVLVSSWLMALDVPLFWVTRVSGLADPLTQYVPYADSYLDQSIMLATTSGVLWHLAAQQMTAARNWLRCFALVGLANVLILMPGRTGYLLAIVALCLAAFFEMPPRFRLTAAVITPVLLGLVLFYTVPLFQARVDQAANELTSYGSAPDVHSSIGARLNMWKLSVQAIAQQPGTGYGVGNWTPVIKRIYGPGADGLFGEGNGSNPHQEMLLWTVELGIAGTLAFIALFLALVYDTRAFNVPLQRATRSVILMLLLACLFNSPLYDDLMGDYFCVALGLLLALGLRDNQPPLPPRVGATDSS